jgi:hypothetical protein
MTSLHVRRFRWDPFVYAEIQFFRPFIDFLLLEVRYLFNEAGEWLWFAGREVFGCGCDLSVAAAAAVDVAVDVAVAVAVAVQ